MCAKYFVITVCIIIVLRVLQDTRSINALKKNRNPLTNRNLKLRLETVRCVYYGGMLLH